MTAEHISELRRAADAASAQDLKALVCSDRLSRPGATYCTLRMVLNSGQYTVARVGTNTSCFSDDESKAQALHDVLAKIEQVYDPF